MSKPLPQTMINRLKWIDALEKHPHKQCTDALFSFEIHPLVREFMLDRPLACAAGMYFEHVEGQRKCPRDDYASYIAEETGLEVHQVTDVISLNDSGVTFPKIAKILRSYA